MRLRLSELAVDLQSPDLIGTADVASRLDVTPDEVRNWADTGILPEAQKVSGRRVFRLADIAAWQIDGLEQLGESAEFSPDVLA